MLSRRWLVCVGSAAICSITVARLDTRSSSASPGVRGAKQRHEARTVDDDVVPEFIDRIENKLHDHVRRHSHAAEQPLSSTEEGSPRRVKPSRRWGPAGSTGTTEVSQEPSSHTEVKQFATTPTSPKVRGEEKEMKNVKDPTSYRAGAYTMLVISAVFFASSQIPQVTENHLYPDRLFEIAWWFQFLLIFSRLLMLIYYSGTRAVWTYPVFTLCQLLLAWGQEFQMYHAWVVRKSIGDGAGGSGAASSGGGGSGEDHRVEFRNEDMISSKQESGVSLSCYEDMISSIVVTRK